MSREDYRSETIDFNSTEICPTGLLCVLCGEEIMSKTHVNHGRGAVAHIECYSKAKE